MRRRCCAQGSRRSVPCETRQRRPLILSLCLVSAALVIWVCNTPGTWGSRWRRLAVAATTRNWPRSSGPTCAWRIPNFMRRLESDTVLDSVFATETNPVLPVPVISQHLTLASVLLIRRVLGGRYNNVGKWGIYLTQGDP